MAESKPIIVKNLDLFNDYRILYHSSTQRLLAITDIEYLRIIRSNNVKFLSELPDYELECFFLNSNTDAVTSHSAIFKADELEGVGYYTDPRGAKTIIGYHTGKI